MKKYHKPIDENELNNETYRIFAKMVNNSAKFMRQWVRCFALTNCRYIKDLSDDYLTSKGMTIKDWIKGLKNNRKADILQCVCDEYGDRHTCICPSGIWSDLDIIKGTPNYSC